jgi:hypothetical protein
MFLHFEFQFRSLHHLLKDFHFLNHFVFFFFRLRGFEQKVFQKTVGLSQSSISMIIITNQMLVI